MLKNPAEKMCRWCKDRVATVQHIVCGCCITRKKHIELHDNIAFAIFHGLQRNMVCFLHTQTETTTLQQSQATTSSSDSERCCSRTNGTTPLHASQMLSSSTKRGCVIDVAVVSSTANMVMGFNAKLEKCEILRRRLQKAKSLKSCETIPVVVTDKGLLHKTTEERLGRIVRVEWKVIRDLQTKAAQLVTRCLVACT